MQTLNSLNPAVIQGFRSNSKDEINQILTLSESKFLTWREVSFKDKGALLLKYADLLEERKEELGALITEEMGKVITQSYKEIEKCALTCRFYAQQAEKYLESEIIKTEASKSYISYHPLGTVLAVMPWNFPFWQVIRFAAPALMAGNTAILKHASNVPKCASIIEELFLEAGFPKGVFQTIFIEGNKMEEIVTDHRIKAVTLTGSEAAGSKVAEAAGRSLKKVVLELGGSDPFVVLEDADLNIAVEVAVKARMINTGQSCISAKRFIVVEGIADKFIGAFKEKLSSLKMGDPMVSSMDYGPLAKVEFAKVLEKQVRSSIQKGANLLLGGTWKEADGAYFPATLLTNVQPGMPAYDDELFGPVASIIIARNDEDAVRIANDTKYGLGASIWTANIEKAERLAARIEAGSVFINKMVSSDPKLPFGGIKLSGYGRELSYLGIREFTNIKAVSIS